MKTSLKVGLFGLVFTYLFFFEYLSPFRWVHIPYDLDGFHYPLMDYGFRALKSGRLPQWDITFSGISYAGNPQTGLFYPGTWILYAANWSREHLSYTSLETFVIAHIWLTFFLGYLWLRHGRLLGQVASITGALIFAFSGLACSQMQHLGLIVVYAWSPLVLLGIDQVVEKNIWNPLAFSAFASAMAFLGGYTPSWAVLALFTLIYGVFRGWRGAVGSIGALVASLLLAMVQLLPTWYLLGTKIPDDRYGGGMGWSFFLSYFIPNFYDFGMEVPAGSNFPNEYLYVGAPCLFGLVCLLWFRPIRKTIPLLACLAVCVVLLTNPFNLIAPLVERVVLLRQLCRSFYFIAGVSLALAGLAAHGLDAFLKRDTKLPGRIAPIFCALAGLWGVVELVRWHQGHFASGWSYESALTFLLFVFGANLVRESTMGKAVIVALLFCLFADYKAFGTSKRFNASAGQYGPIFTPEGFREMDKEALQEIQQHPEYRVLSDIYLNPLLLRHFSFATPQGFDPFLPAAYESELRQRNAEFRSNWEFGIAPENTDLVRYLGVRYWITSAVSPLYPKLKSLPRFRELGREPRFYRVFLDSEAEAVAPNAQVLAWTPEYRKLRTTASGKYVLKENALAGWEASVDGNAVPVSSDHAFVAVDLPAGEHVVEFRYRTKGLVAGAWVSGLSAIGLLVFGLNRRR